MKKDFHSIATYNSEFSAEVALILNKLTRLIQKEVPTAEETISYNMPAFKYNNHILVYFAAYKDHIGFYALPSGNTAFREELSRYKTGKGSIQFPLDEELPFELIAKMIKFRIKEIDD